MATPYLGEIKIFSFGFAPKGWAMCNGQLMSIQQNTALFSLLGTFYGGDGAQTFGLPDFQGRIPVHQGNTYVIGQTAGEEGHTLLQQEMPIHSHIPVATTSDASSPGGNNNMWARNNANPYTLSTSNLVPMAGTALNLTGGGQPHNNMPPFLTLNFCIALVGIFPTRN